MTYTYNVTYPSGRVLRVRNSNPKRLEAILDREQAKGTITGWQRDAEANRAEREFVRAFTENKYGELA